MTTIYILLYAVTWAFLAVFRLVGWSGLNDQAMMLKYNTLKGVYQVVYQSLPSDQFTLLEYNTLKGVYLIRG